ncbi:MAG: NAD(P)/FAD-dependent oxidoreductase [bacterium]
MVYDVAIIGTGPAGVSAALNLKIHEKNFIWIGKKTLSDKLSKAECVSNYPGFIDVPGSTLNEAFLKQVEAMGIEITEAMVNQIMPMGDHYALMAGPDFYEAKALILTTGVNQTGGLKGEADFLGRGVSYCATCDGGLYRGKTVAVVCNAPRFEHEAAFLASLASKVYFFPYYRNAALSGENIELPAGRPVGVQGDMRVTGLTMNDGSTLPVDGLFCLRDSISLNTLLPGLNSENGHISVDRGMATNLPGVYAAGDCTGRPYQYTKAVGEGNVAAHSVLDYLAGK